MNKVQDMSVLTKPFKETTKEILNTPVDIRIERNEDMSRDGKLRLIQQEDGDIIVSVINSEDKFMPSVEFCSIHCGGGRSPHTIKALRNLMKAMKKDNEQTPIG